MILDRKTCFSFVVVCRWNFTQNLMNFFFVKCLFDLLDDTKVLQFSLILQNPQLLKRLNLPFIIYLLFYWCYQPQNFLGKAKVYLPWETKLFLIGNQKWPIWKCQSSDLPKLLIQTTRYKIQDNPFVKFSNYQVTNYRFFGPTGFPVWHFQTGQKLWTWKVENPKSWYLTILGDFQFFKFNLFLSFLVSYWKNIFFSEQTYFCLIKKVFGMIALIEKKIYYKR